MPKYVKWLGFWGIRAQGWVEIAALGPPVRSTFPP
jgi:hypothetical protein